MKPKVYVGIALISAVFMLTTIMAFGILPDYLTTKVNHPVITTPKIVQLQSVSQAQPTIQVQPIIDNNQPIQPIRVTRAS